MRYREKAALCNRYPITASPHSIAGSATRVGPGGCIKQVPRCRLLFPWGVCVCVCVFVQPPARLQMLPPPPGSACALSPVDGASSSLFPLRPEALGNADLSFITLTVKANGWGFCFLDGGELASLFDPLATCPQPLVPTGEAAPGVPAESPGTCRPLCAVSKRSC